MDPVEKLKNEHQHILRGLSLLDKTSKYFLKGEILEEQISSLVTFFRNYADAGHHAKEEDILFVKLFEKDDSLNSDYSPLSVLQEHHVRGRQLVGEIDNINDSFPSYVKEYNMLLERHIDMEDELFPELVKEHLTRHEIESLSLDFESVDTKNQLDKYLAILDKVSINL